MVVSGSTTQKPKLGYFIPIASWEVIEKALVLLFSLIFFVFIREASIRELARFE